MEINGTAFLTIVGVAIAGLTVIHLASDGLATGVGWLLEKCAGLLFRNRKVLSGSEALPGTIAVVSRAFATSGAKNQSGWVTVRGESWRAHLIPGETHAPGVGESVLVSDIDGLVLIVTQINRGE